MIDKLTGLVEKYNQLQQKISDPQIIKKQSEYRDLVQEMKELEPVIDAYTGYQEAEKKIEECTQLKNSKDTDAEFLSLVEEELAEALQAKEALTEKIKFLLIPKDKDEDKDLIMEIRAGTGGDEASLFAADLYRMYLKFIEASNFKGEVISFSETGLKGFKEIIFSVTGKKAYGTFKYETGVHRVQRIPETESSGRIHTSAVTVAVLPAVEEKEININEKDLRIETYRASGAGGQHVNTTDSAVRITHLPSNTVVTCQDEKSQHKNKAKAMKVLCARIYENIRAKQQQKIAADRKTQVGSGDRSERIRTYNYPQNRVTDHRLGQNYNLEVVINGAIEDLLTALMVKDKQDKLSDLS